jgi:ribosomal protein S18 acetylase RimI-like enzyme
MKSFNKKTDLHHIVDNKCFYYKHLTNNGTNPYINLVQEDYEKEFKNFATFSASPGASLIFYNYSMTRGKTTKEKISKIIIEASKRQLPVSLFSFGKENEKLYEDLGFYKIMEGDSHMVAEIPREQKPKSPPEGYIVGEIENLSKDDPIWSQWVKVLSSAMSMMNFESLNNVLSNSSCGKNSPLRHFYVMDVSQKKVVTVGTIFMDKDVVGVYNMGSLKEVRGKGLAMRLLEHILLDVARDEKGFSFSVLQASSSAIPLYQRIGFELSENYDLWIRFKQGNWFVWFLGLIIVNFPSKKTWKILGVLLLLIIFYILIKKFI